MFSDFEHPRTRGGGGSKKGKLLQTSFMDGPLSFQIMSNLASTTFFAGIHVEQHRFELPTICDIAGLCSTFFAVQKYFQLVSYLPCWTLD